jgi:hypothetical protein
VTPESSALDAARLLAEHRPPVFSSTTPNIAQPPSSRTLNCSGTFPQHVRDAPPTAMEIARVMAVARSSVVAVSGAADRSGAPMIGVIIAAPSSTGCSRRAAWGRYLGARRC